MARKGHCLFSVASNLVEFTMKTRNTILIIIVIIIITIIKYLLSANLWYIPGLGVLYKKKEEKKERLGQ